MDTSLPNMFYHFNLNCLPMFPLLFFNPLILYIVSCLPLPLYLCVHFQNHYIPHSFIFVFHCFGIDQPLTLIGRVHLKENLHCILTFFFLLKLSSKKMPQFQFHTLLCKQQPLKQTQG